MIISLMPGRSFDYRMRRLTFTLTWVTLLATVASAIWLPGEVTIGLFVVVVTGFLVLVSVARRRYVRTRDANKKELMRAAGMCVACGYFYRVKTDRCPECGTPVERPK